MNETYSILTSMFQICIALLCLAKCVQLAPTAITNDDRNGTNKVNIEKWKAERTKLEAAVRNVSTNSRPASSDRSIDGGQSGQEDKVNEIITNECKEFFEDGSKLCRTFRSCCILGCQLVHLRAQSQCTDGSSSPRCQCSGSGGSNSGPGATPRPQTEVGGVDDPDPDEVQPVGPAPGGRPIIGVGHGKATDPPRRTPRPIHLPIPIDEPDEGPDTDPTPRPGHTPRPRPTGGVDGPDGTDGSDDETYPPFPPGATLRPPSGGSGQSCGKSIGQGDRIIGGDIAAPHSWPWQISLLYAGKSWRHICGGSVIDENHILTAAHCVEEDLEPANYKVGLGMYDRANIGVGEGTIVTVSSIIVNPKRQSDLHSYDGAILRLPNRIHFSETVSPVCLPQHDVSPNEKNCFVTGWGLEAFDGSSEPTSVLMQASSPIVNSTICSRYAQKAGLPEIDPSMICAGTMRKGACKGDSGGPMVCRQGGSWTLYGITSWSSPRCATETMPTVYGRVMAMMDWIQKATRSHVTS